MRSSGRIASGWVGNCSEVSCAGIPPEAPVASGSSGSFRKGRPPAEAPTSAAEAKATGSPELATEFQRRQILSIYI